MKRGILFFILISNTLYSYEQQVKDEEFWQEYHEPCPMGKNSVENEVRSIAVDEELKVWIATREGIFAKAEHETNWQPQLHNTDRGPAFAVAISGPSDVWLGTWKGVFLSQKNVIRPIDGTEGPISAICSSGDGVYAAGPRGVWFYNGRTFIKKNYSIARSVRSIVSDDHGGVWIGTDVGLYHCSDSGTNYYQQKGFLLSAYIKGVALDADQKLWAAGLGGVTIISAGKKERVIRPQDGCPSIYVNCVRRSPDGAMWVGTQVGVVRYMRDGTHSLRFTRRWLLDDNVRDVAFDKQGNAWIATANGVSAIRKKRMTLLSKQEYFYDILMKRHIREPWIAGQCRLATPGDINSWQPDDDDNDGEFTGNYLTMESFRYAVTKSEDAKEKAGKAFGFLKKLQQVTGSDGFFARSIVPIDWKYGIHDTNRAYSDKELAEELVKEPRYKPVCTRWRKSADGKWLWKGDASSDELCGHMMGYFFYYQLVADDREKNIISKHVALLVDHIIANNFNMIDVDGAHTRWAVWSPDQLNRDPEWAPDKRQNSMELLTFLKLAYYMTGNIKYQQHYSRLIKEEHYLENMADLLNQDPAWFIYYDVTMQAYLYPILLHCETDPPLRAFYQKHLDSWMDRRRNDKNPLINFLYCFAKGVKDELPASVDFLRDTPLDLIDWTVDHTKREDVQLVHEPVLNDLQVKDLPPASIRVAVRWDKNPWVAVNGFPDMEREPVFWLLPYWMGRYLKMIGP